MEQKLKELLRKVDETTNYHYSELIAKDFQEIIEELQQRKPECVCGEDSGCKFEENGYCLHPNPEIKPTPCLSWTRGENQQ